MTLLDHLARTDLRRFRWGVAAAIALSAAVAAAEVLAPLATAQPRVMTAVTLSWTLIWLANILAIPVVVALVVQAHPLVGSDAFWMTRPVPPRDLLGSKLLLFAVIFVALPVIWELGAMSLYSVPPRRMILVAIQSALFQALIVVVLMVPASVTRTLAGFAMVCGAAVVLQALTLAIMAVIYVSRLDEGYAGAMMVAIPAGSVALADDGTSFLIECVLSLAAALLFLAVHYRTRLRSRSVPVGLAALALGWAVGALWPWPLFREPLVAPAWAGAPGTLRLTAEPSSVRFESDAYWTGGERKWRHARAHVKAAGLEPGWRASVRVAAASVDLAERGRLRSRAVTYAESVALDAPDEVQEREVIRDLLGVTRLGGINRARAEDVIVLLLAEGDFAPHRGTSGSYSGTFVVELARDEIASVLPLRTGASHQEGADRFAIDEVKYAGRPSIRLRRSGAGTIFERRAPPSYSYYLRNGRRGEAVAVYIQPMLQTPFASSGAHVSVLGWTGFSVEEEQLFTSAATSELPEYAVPVDRNWLADAELVIVRTTQAGSVVRPLEISGFPVKEQESTASRALGDWSWELFNFPGKKASRPGIR